MFIFVGSNLQNQYSPLIAVDISKLHNTLYTIMFLLVVLLSTPLPTMATCGR